MKIELFKKDAEIKVLEADIDYTGKGKYYIFDKEIISEKDLDILNLNISKKLSDDNIEDKLNCFIEDEYRENKKHLLFKVDLPLDKMISFVDIIKIQDNKIQDELKEIGLKASIKDMGMVSIIMIKLYEYYKKEALEIDKISIEQQFKIFNEIGYELFNINFINKEMYSKSKIEIENFINSIKDFCKNNINIDYISIYNLGCFKVLRDGDKIDLKYYYRKLA